eukprot:4297412-Pyramimonas_sp.AAC.1
MEELRAKLWARVEDAARAERGDGEDGADEEEEHGHWHSPDHMAGISRPMEMLPTVGVDQPTRRGQ